MSPRLRSSNIAREIGHAGSAVAAHVWRNAAAGNLGGWQVARALEFLTVLIGSCGNSLEELRPMLVNKFIPAPPLMPTGPKVVESTAVGRGISACASLR